MFLNRRVAISLLAGVVASAFFVSQGLSQSVSPAAAGALEAKTGDANGVPALGDAVVPPSQAAGAIQNFDGPQLAPRTDGPPTWSGKADAKSRQDAIDDDKQSEAGDLIAAHVAKVRALLIHLRSTRVHRKTEMTSKR